MVANSNRFIWDLWNVQNQYRLLRTPAESFFPKEIYQPFLAHLLSWSRSNLGCQMISHPWLSAYVDGCYQNLHSDVPHGPYSFVFSLTDWKNRTYRGGETQIATPTLLNYFDTVTHQDSHESGDFLKKIEPSFNRLVCFDPRYPHGVARLSGAEDLLESRLVIHGWFTEPRPMVEGVLSVRSCLKGMDQLAENWMHSIQNESVFGLLSVQVLINREGKIESKKILCGHLINSKGITISKTALKKNLAFSTVFPKSSGKTVLTLPLEFRKD